MKDKENKNQENQEEITIEEIENEIKIKDSLKKLREKLRKCVEEKQEYLNGWQRAKADLINFKKENESQKKGLISFANEKMTLDLIPILDSFDMALSNSDKKSNGQEWRKGLENIYNQFISTLKNFNIEVLNPLNEKFNPATHHSVGLVDIDDKKKDGIILEVIQKGYNLNNKNIRPASVKVGQFSKN